MVVENLLAELLLKKQELTVSGLGKFVLNTDVRWENADKHTIYNISFTFNTSASDNGEFADFAAAKGAEATSAAQDLRKKVGELLSSMSANERTLWQGIGMFIKFDETVIFSPSVRFPFGKTTYQLGSKVNGIEVFTQRSVHGLKKSAMETAYVADRLYNGQYGKAVRVFLLLASTSILASFVYYVTIPGKAKSVDQKDKTTLAAKLPPKAVADTVADIPVPPDLLELAVVERTPEMQAFAITTGVFTNEITLAREVRRLRKGGLTTSTVKDFKNRMILCIGHFKTYKEALDALPKLKAQIPKKRKSSNDQGPFIQKIVQR